MKDAAREVKSAEITTAVRDTVLNGENIVKGQYLGILEGEIVAHLGTVKETVTALLNKMVDEDEDSVISFYYGEDVKEEEAEEICSMTEELYGDFDVEVLNGGQPVYNYIISVE